MKTTYFYNHYDTYEELKNKLETFAKTYPDLISLEVLCVTAGGRNQYAATLTNKKTGSALSKPGWYLDGNIHAGEVTSSMCAMNTIDTLLTNYGSDPVCTDILDHKTVYVIPRVTPDGAEVYLTTPYTLRSINKPIKEEKGGIAPQDLDDDGVIRMMRIPTPYGAWKKDPDSPCAMKKRSPSDVTGEFYDIYPEGIMEEAEGNENLKQKKTVWSLDFNRNFPYGWFPDARQAGAGSYPLSNPECKAIVDFVLAHPNIGGAAIGHTSGGIILYPPGTRPEKTSPAQDMQFLKEIADMGREELGYAPMNIFDSFMDDQEHYDSGALDDWFYQDQGIPAYTMEFWDVASKAGMPYDWGSRKKESPEKQLERFNALMKWVIEHAPQYYMDWQPYEHPYFGKVEIGGFNTKFTIQNPPENMLADECAKDTAFNLRYIEAMPQLSIDSVSSEKAGEDLYKVTALIGNHGYLPTNLTQQAVSMNKAESVRASISGGVLLAGKETEDCGNLEGFGCTMTGTWYGNLTTFFSARAKKKLSWIVKAPAGTELTITASQPKAGTVQKTITL
ncbi:MAG: M14 family metallopeptidase [Bulleidia sp.]